MRKKKIISILLISINLNTALYASSSLRFEEKIKKTCGVVFDKQLGIVFKDEKPKYYSNIILYSNDPRNDKVKLKISKLLKARNLSSISNSDISLVFNKTKKVKLSTFTQNTILLNKGKHLVHLEINQYRSLIYSGTASLEFELEAICK